MNCLSITAHLMLCGITQPLAVGHSITPAEVHARGVAKV